MAGERARLAVSPRDGGGSPEARRLRRQGLVPGVLYGAGKSARPFAVPERELRRVFAGHGLHQILDVVVEGTERPHHAVLKEYQLDPTRNRLVHIDLHEVRLDRAIQASVVVELVGDSEGVNLGGVLSQSTREVNVEALPMEIPETLSLDVSGLGIGDSARIGDIVAPEGVTILDDPETTVATVTPPTVIEEPEAVEEAEPGAEPAEGAEGAAEEPAEPEAEAAGEPGTVPG